MENNIYVTPLSGRYASLEMSRLFSNLVMDTVSEEFNDIKKLEELEEEFKKYQKDIFYIMSPIKKAQFCNPSSSWSLSPKYSS